MEQTRTTADHPAMALWDALGELAASCSRAPMFRDLAERRRDASTFRLDTLNALASVASERAHAKARDGASIADTVAEFAELNRAAAIMPPIAEPPDTLATLREALDAGRGGCERALKALRAGGAGGLDAATQPNAVGQPRSVELHSRLQEADGVFVALSVALADPMFKLDDHAASMADLGGWFARARDELGAVIETQGLDAPAPTAATVESPGTIGELRAIRAAIESLHARDDDEAPPAVKLPTLKPWAWEAWKANQVGMTATAIAATLAKKHNDPKITQPRVSEQIQRAKLHAEASGLADDAAKALPQVGSRAPARTLDPAAAEQGTRTDGRAHHLRERERQKAKDGHDED